MSTDLVFIYVMCGLRQFAQRKWTTGHGHNKFPVTKFTISKYLINHVSSSCRATQTDIPTTPTLVPICVPAFMPMPMQMYNAPYPVPIPVPVPVPVPVFVPTSRNSYRDHIDCCDACQLMVMNWLFRMTMVVTEYRFRCPQFVCSPAKWANYKLDPRSHNGMIDMKP